MEQTRKLWRILQSGKYKIIISDLVLAEINECKEPKRRILKEYLSQINYERVNITEETEEIAFEIIDEGILNKKSFDDCMHIASAILNDCNIIVSWNFKHMVNVDTINGIRKITFARRYNNIDIYAPYVLLSEKRLGGKMKKPNISKDFTIEDIHKIREYNAEKRKKMTVEERIEDIKKEADKCEKDIKELKKDDIAM